VLYAPGTAAVLLQAPWDTQRADMAWSDEVQGLARVPPMEPSRTSRLCDPELDENGINLLQVRTFVSTQACATTHSLFLWSAC